jgi:hypothetical protein
MINYSEKFLFIHVPRTGGTSIEAFLTESGAEVVELPRDRAVEEDLLRFQHLHASKALEVFEDRGLPFAEFFKFSFMRNPWERLVSFFFYDHHTYVALGQAEDITFAEYVKIKISRHPFTFKPYNRNEFIFGGMGKRPKEIRRVTFTPGFWLLDNQKNVLVDFVGRFENLQGDFDKICDRLKIPRGSLRKLRACGDPDSCPWHKDQGITIPKYDHYTKYYDDETLEIVNCLIGEEAEVFGYKFGD